MVKGKRIVVTASASKNLYSILEFWNQRTGSKQYSKKLRNLFYDAFEEIRQFNQSGFRTTDPDIRVEIVKYYLIFYRVTEINIQILLIRDSRMDPDAIPVKKI